MFIAEPTDRLTSSSLLNLNRRQTRTVIGAYPLYRWVVLNCADEAVRKQQEYSAEPVYYYLFGHRGVASFTEIFGGGDRDFGVCHADELQYLFPVGDGLFPDRKPSSDDKQVAELLTTMWANFARTGNPTPELNNIVKEKWKPATPRHMEYYYFKANKSNMRSGLYLKRAKLWRHITSSDSCKDIKDEL
ncbi:hypothetical protein NQ317_006574 [Molorchus minor]|uniref:Carboxylesterase type B domain-containing protein n=1 Tax=Molorchus minor TaxID=1323400 RepID=A0ABQ9K0E3_9CUCU|nr:hypothetical protein NQ317_006574 [Molorchus minor]